MNGRLQAEKKKLREMILAQRDAMPADVRRAASITILNKVCALPQYAKAKAVLTYMGFGSEIETQSFLNRIIADGKIAVLPRVDRASQALALHPVRSIAELLQGKWGILEPPTHAPMVSISAIDFVLIPGVAFDRLGNRLGYGRGYYDKLLSAATPALARVSAAFPCQIVDVVPVGSDDQQVHCVITENETITNSHDR
jgi:5-formyltetrahydrofolate cyclo-ligase